MSERNKIIKALHKRLRRHIEADSLRICHAGYSELGYTRSILAKHDCTNYSLDVVLTTKFNDVDAMFVTLVIRDAEKYVTLYCDMHYSNDDVADCVEHCATALCEQLYLNPQELYTYLKDSSKLPQMQL